VDLLVLVPGAHWRKPGNSCDLSGYPAKWPASH